MEAKSFISDKLVCTVRMTLSISIIIVNNANVFPFLGSRLFPFVY
jgi:hypothetical protein